MPHWGGQTLSLTGILPQLLLPIFNFFFLAEHPISISSVETHAVNLNCWRIPLYAPWKVRASQGEQVVFFFGYALGKVGKVFNFFKENILLNAGTFLKTFLVKK